MKELFHELNKSVLQGQHVALATVVSSKGSLPMSKRAKMLVFQDGASMGTVGGGILEATTINEAQHVLETNIPKILAVDLTSEQVEADGLTCGGTVEIFIEPVTPDADRKVFTEIVQLYETARPAVVITRLDTSEAEPRGGRKLLLRADGTLCGTLGHQDIDLNAARHAGARMGQPFLGTTDLDLSPEARRLFGTDSLRLFLESLLPAPTAYLFGGGHVSLHLSKILHFIGFDYVVIDDRQDFVTRERFPDARALMVQPFEHVVDSLTLIPQASYLIIVTRGHKSDLIVLKQALQTDARYIGMIGSSRKIALLFQRLRDEGIPQAQLDRVHSPIGLEIGADTPEEIAISIAAELILVRRNESSSPS